MDARRLTRASASRPPAAATNDAPQLPEEEAAPRQLHPSVSVKWPEGGALTLDWVDALGRALDFASRNLQPADLPTILPVSVCDSLLLVAQKVSEIGKF